VKKIVMFAGLLTVPALAVSTALLIHPPTGVPVAKATTLSGDFTLWAATPKVDPCQTGSDVPDVHAGAPVDVRDESGTTVAGAVLDQGIPEETHRGCVYHFTVAKLPSAKTYTVQVGARVGPTYQRSDLARHGWKVAMSLGTPAAAA
jgi:hypothetical protein